MNSLYEALKKHKLHPKAYQKIKSVYVINNGTHSLVIKLNTNNYDIYKYLISRDFIYFPEYYNDANDNYDILEYIDNLNVNTSQKVNDYIRVLSILHYKTSYKREIDLDQVKKEYEELTNKIVSLKNYYYNLNDMIDKEMFLSPAMYLLIRNISLIYEILDRSVIMLNELYEKTKNDKSIRVSLLHNNPDLDHLITNDHSYLISWDKSYFESPVYELEEFYRKYYHYIEISDYIKTYELNNKLSDTERQYLLILLLIPHEIRLTNDTYHDTEVINNEINYLTKVYELLKKDNNI